MQAGPEIGDKETVSGAKECDPAQQCQDPRNRAELETQIENAEERIRDGGPGRELIRRGCVASLRSRMDAWYEHGSDSDLFALCAAFHLMEYRADPREPAIRHGAELLESLLLFLSLCPEALLAMEQATPRGGG